MMNDMKQDMIRIQELVGNAFSVTGLIGGADRWCADEPQQAAKNTGADHGALRAIYAGIASAL